MYKKLSCSSVFSSNIYKLLAVVGCILLVSLVFRVVFLFTYANFPELKPFVGDTFFAFVQGARFDLLLACYFLIPNIIFSILAAVTKQRAFEKIARVWSCIALIFYSAVLIVDFYYYSFFGTHFNILAFGMIDDDQGAVLTSMWTDFPVIRIALFFIILSILECYVIKRIYKSAWIVNISKKRTAKLLLILLIPLYILAMRGSIGPFPLRQPDANFSKSSFVNALTTNGIFSLKTAYSEYKGNKNSFSTDINSMLTQAGYASGEELASAFTGLPVDSIVDDPLFYFQQQTEQDSLLAKNPPHIIVFQMEGMGLNMMNLHSEKFNILGKLADELPYCITYKNFMPSYEGTIASLEGILTATAIVPVSGSTHANKQLYSSFVLPFKSAGYETTFTTGGKAAWRNIDIYTYAQGFDKFEGMETIKADLSEAIEDREWGVDDEFLFKYIWQKLKGAKSPQLIYGMSITNHTPYVVPSRYAIDLSIDDSVKDRLLQSEDMAIACFRTYRYACDWLGDFINKVRNSELGANTIIAITGDHSIKGMVRVDGENLLENHGVPFILYVPPKYLENKTIDTTYWGSHKDIFPTLINLALSNTEYYRLGEDMLSSEASNNIAVDVQIGTFNRHGVIGNGRFYEWQNGSLVAVDEANADLLDLQYKNHLWYIASRYVVLRSITDNK